MFSGLAVPVPLDPQWPTASGEPKRWTVPASPRYIFFSILAVRPELGLCFIPKEDEEGRDAVVVISHAPWERRFGSRPDHEPACMIFLLLDGRPHAVVGVMPADSFVSVGCQLDWYITFGPRVDSFWKPIAFTTGERESEGDFNFAVIARVDVDVSIAAARQQMDVLTQQNLERINQLAPANFEMFTRLHCSTRCSRVTVAGGNLLLEAAVGLLLPIAWVSPPTRRWRAPDPRAEFGGTRSARRRTLKADSAVVDGELRRHELVVRSKWSLRRGRPFCCSHTAG